MKGKTGCLGFFLRLAYSIVKQMSVDQAASSSSSSSFHDKFQYHSVEMLVFAII